MKNKLIEHSDYNKCWLTLKSAECPINEFGNARESFCLSRDGSVAAEDSGDIQIVFFKDITNALFSKWYMFNINHINYIMYYPWI